VKQTIVPVRFCAIATLPSLWLSIRHRSGYLIGPLAFLLVLGVVETVMVFRIQRRAAQDPTFLLESENETKRLTNRS